MWPNGTHSRFDQINNNFYLWFSSKVLMKQDTHYKIIVNTFHDVPRIIAIMHPADSTLFLEVLHLLLSHSCGLCCVVDWVGANVLLVWQGCRAPFKNSRAPYKPWLLASWEYCNRSDHKTGYASLIVSRTIL